MNQGFSWKYDQMQANDPTRNKDENGSGPGGENYDVPSQTRTICFVLADGRRLFLNYAYLVSGEFLPEENKIILSFTTHTITLAGIYFEKLFNDLMQGLPRQLTCTDERYNDTQKEGQPAVNEIIIVSNSV